MGRSLEQMKLELADMQSWANNGLWSPELAADITQLKLDISAATIEEKIERLDDAKKVSHETMGLEFTI